MMSKSFVIDNSVVMSWCFKDEISQYADGVLDLLQESTAYVPSIWPLEVVNVLIVAERKRRLRQADSIRFMTLLSQLPIIVEYERTGTIMNDLLVLARANNLSSYDASYLDLSMRRGLPIATMDTRLIKAAKKSNVPVIMG